MSKQTDIFNYSQGKRDIGHSKFDMSFTNVRTQNFGQLLPVAVYETLPDDYWNIGSDGVTLLKPLTAPAFTSIKQHFYAFYTRNQQVWKHWNNFITNGTEMGQVYGSNQSNQASDSPWKVPYIPAMYLQMISKIAHGYSLFPLKLDGNVSTVFGGSLAFISSCLKNASSSKRYDVTDLVLLGITHSLHYVDLMSVVRDLYQFLVDFAEKYFIRFFIKGSNLLVLYDGSYSMESTMKYYFNGSYVTAGGSWSSTFGNDVDSDVDVTSSSLPVIPVMFIFDDYASECSVSNSPFSVNQITEYNSVYNTQLKSFERIKRSCDYQINYLNRAYQESGVGTSAVEIYSGVFREKVESAFWGCRYYFEGHFYHDVDSDDHYEAVMAYPGYMYKYGFDKTSDFYWEFELTMKQVGDSDYVGGPWTYLDADKAAMDLLPLVPTSFGGSMMDPFKCVVKDESWSTIWPEVPSDSSFYSSITSFQPFEDSQSSLNGYTKVGFLTYLCRNSSTLLDSLHIPDVALATRSFEFYSFERFNALLFFAYSHIWEDHFRNRAVSSPELDYSGSNGSIYSDSAFNSWLNGCKSLFSTLPSYAEDVDFTTLAPNSWSLHFDAMPRNGLDPVHVNKSTYAQYFNGTRHYFNVSSKNDVFALLTGCALRDVVLYRLFSQVDGLGDFYTFSELFTKNFYLPNYYNGLLHCKYQNFNKDYFTSGMLDPMSGANDLSLGSTVSELRVSEIKQSWFERIAQNRTVKAFMQRIFGITPIEEPKESRLLGVDHVPIKIGEVIQTSQSTDTSVQGQRSGLGGGRGGHGLVHDRCNEHGWLIILSSFTVESQYMQGLERTFEVKDSYMDYPTVDFAHIGNESILMKELNFDGPSVGGYPFYYGLNLSREKVSQDGPQPVASQGVSFNPWRVVSVSPSGAFSNPSLVNNVVSQSGTGIYNVFGYIPRYSSYKFKLDEVHGEFRDELLFWHTFRRFHTMPMLSHSFVNWEMLADDNDFNRLFAVSKDDVDAKFCCSTFFNASVSRALPYVCVPKSSI